MDPNVALGDIRKLWDQVSDTEDQDARNFLYLDISVRFAQLDAWISAGGFFPSAWTEAQRTALENNRKPAWKSPAGEPDDPEPLTRQQTWLAQLRQRRYTGVEAPQDDGVNALTELLTSDPWRQ